jgi:hypothetical protein
MTRPAPKYWQGGFGHCFSAQTRPIWILIMENALFFKAKRTLFLHIYVDDDLIVGQCSSEIKAFLSKLQETYKIKI